MSHRKLNSNEVHWKLTTGCNEIGPGCESCPAMVDKDAHTIKIWPDRLSEPALMKEPKTFYLSLGSDFFQDEVPDELIFKAFRAMNFNPIHKFVIGTKRIERLQALAGKLKFTDNIYIGVAVVANSCKPRIDALRSIESNNRFLSMAPLLEDLGELNLEGIQLVGVVAESWGHKRGIQQSWVDNVERQCQEQNVNFTFGDALLWTS